jgi:hypothetical protein
VLTEGRRTEVEYLAKWAAERRESVVVDFDPYHGVPMPLVERAVQLVAERKRAIRGGRGEALFDEIWCVFDRDEHPLVDEALHLAAEHGVGIAFSNPCFELWLVLHGNDLRRHTERRDAQKASEELGFTVGKGLQRNAWPLLKASWEQAEQRSDALDAMHLKNGSPHGANPSTSVAQLVRSLHGK